MFLLCSKLPQSATPWRKRGQVQWSQSVKQTLVRLLPKAECLNLHWFRSLRHARDEVERWRRHYNTERPHSALGYRTPMEVLITHAATAPEPLAGSALPLIAQFK